MDKGLAVAIGNAARHARHALQLTQQQMAERVGVSVEFYSRMERGRAHPRIETFLRMLDALEVSADTLLGVDAARAAAPAVPLTSPGDPREVRDVVAALQRLPRSAMRLVTGLLNELEAVGATAKRRRRAGRRSNESPATPRKQ